VKVSLRPLREEEFPQWARHHRVWYTADLRENGGLSDEAAVEKAQRDMDRAFPSGFATPDNSCFVVEAAGERVGSVWFSPRQENGETVAFLYAIEIDEAHRGRGFGRAAMQLFEQEARRRGFSQVRLNVFGGNERARALYRSLGYGERSVHMGKAL
jgi:ribosomal protein S18 acetylase RimI-like enzyme